MAKPRKAKKTETPQEYSRRMQQETRDAASIFGDIDTLTAWATSELREKQKRKRKERT